MEEKTLRVGLKIDHKPVVIILIAYGVMMAIMLSIYTNEFYNKDIGYYLFSVFPFYASMTLLPLSAIALLFHFYVSKMSITITNKRVYGQTAFGKRIDLPLDKISSVGTCFYKGLMVATSSGVIRFIFLKNYLDLHKEISNLLNERQDINKPKEEKVVIESSNADEIKKYKELLDMGAITKTEYDKKKKELLK